MSTDAEKWERRWGKTLTKEVNQHDVESIVDRCFFGVEARFRTWSFINAAGQHANEGNTEQAWRFLERADRALGLDDRLDVNHPKIAEDYGGDKELWDIRKKIRKAKDQLTARQLKDAEDIITRLDGFFFFHSLRRTIQCVLGLIDPEFGIA